MERIYGWLEVRSPKGAANWFAAFDNAAQSLLSDPNSFALAPESSEVDCEVRNITFRTRRGRPYRILYTVIGDEIRILHVRMHGQDLLSDIGPLDGQEDDQQNRDEWAGENR